MDISLTDEQKNTLVSYINRYREWLHSPKGLKDTKEHRDHEKFFKEKFAISQINEMSEKEFREAYKTLWASNFWGNKDWYIDNKLIQVNGLEKIKQGLKQLLYGEKDIGERYDEFRDNIKGFGPSSITEILHFVFPEKYCLWNEKPKTVLPFLKLNTLLPEERFKYQVSTGDQYLQCLHALEAIKNELAEYGFKDFIDLDIYFWYIYENVIPCGEEKPQRQVTKTIPSLSINSHEGAEYYLLELGKMLGFNPYTVDQSKVFENKTLGEVAILKSIPPFAGERDMNTVKEIDVIWFGDDENPKMCFEIEHTTDIVHGLDRLIQLQHIYAKFFIVAPEERRAKFQDLVTHRYPYRKFCNRFKFISYNELANLLELALPFHKLKTELFGE